MSSHSNAWTTYEVKDVQTIEVSDIHYVFPDKHVLMIETFNTKGERVTIYLNNVSLDMIADAIGCEQMSIQATEQEGLLA